MSLLLLFAAIGMFPLSPDNIYIGSAFPWTIYYDANKEYPVVEISGVKYGSLDFLTLTASDPNSVAKSEQGKLYEKGNDLYYHNDSLKINVKLKKIKYTSKIDYQRQKLFRIYVFQHLPFAVNSVNFDSLDFQEKIKTEYLFFRDNRDIEEHSLLNRLDDMISRNIKN